MSYKLKLFFVSTYGFSIKVKCVETVFKFNTICELFVNWSWGGLLKAVEGKTNSLLRVFDVPLFGFRNSVEKLCDSWVQTRGYEACVFCMPIPLRVCLTEVPTRRETFLQNYRKPNKHHPLIFHPSYCII